MNPLDSLKAGVAGIAEKITGENPKLLPEVIKLVQNMPGGVSGLLKQFQEKGLVKVVSSDLKTVSPEQVLQVFGSEKINALASATGLDPKVVPEKVATILPKVVEQLTPTAKMAGVA
jgi:uncharacterized protein YidB (DUF937 family)